MTAPPELPDSIWVGDTQYLPVCPGCGRPVEAGGDRKPFSICRSCYDAYVDNAGR